MAGENDVEKPVYDSSDGPVPKMRQNQTGARGKADVFVSGESFGGSLRESLRESLMSQWMLAIRDKGL